MIGSRWGHTIGIHVHTWNKEKPSKRRVCSYSRWDVTTDCQNAGPDHVACDQPMEIALGEGISHPQKADRQKAAACKDLMTTFVHGLKPDPWGFCSRNLSGISVLSVLVTAPQTLAQAEAGKKQGLFYHFVDRKPEHIKSKGAIHKPKYKKDLILPL